MLVHSVLLSSTCLCFFLCSLFIWMWRRHNVDASSINIAPLLFQCWEWEVCAESLSRCPCAGPRVCLGHVNWEFTEAAFFSCSSFSFPPPANLSDLLIKARQTGCYSHAITISLSCSILHHTSVANILFFLCSFILFSRNIYVYNNNKFILLYIFFYIK